MFFAVTWSLETCKADHYRLDESAEELFFLVLLKKESSCAGWGRSLWLQPPRVESERRGQKIEIEKDTLATSSKFCSRERAPSHL